MHVEDGKKITRYGATKLINLAQNDKFSAFAWNAHCCVMCNIEELT